MKIKILIVSYFLVIACFSLKAQLHFTLLKPDQTGIDFVNAIQETAQINEFSYSYLYNGGGVAVGDINNDGLPDLYFSGNMVTNKLYLNLGNFKFKDITDSAGVKGEYGYQTGVTMADINQDGFLDIYVCKSAMPNTEARRNVLYINNGNLTFTNQAKQYGIDDASYSTQAYFYDMDLDSDLDLFLVNHPYNMKNANSIQLSYDKAGKLKADEDTERTFVSSRYYENINGVFKDKTLAAGLGTHSFGLSAIIDDFNEDGYPDIYLCNDYHKPDYLFINNKNKKYTNKADEFFQHFSYSSMGSDYADINNDGYLDLMVLDMLPETFQKQKLLKGQGNYDNLIKRVHYGFGYQYTKNVLQLNNGNQTYSDISYLSGVAFTDWSWAPLIADFDNDGLKDIYITNGYLRDVTDMDFMMYNSDSLKKELYKTKNSEDAMKVLNGIPSKPTINYYFKNNGNLTFNNINKTCGLDIPSYSNGGVYCDLDNDGDLDLVVNNLFSPPFIYSNNTSENHLANFVRFKLKGETANPFGIGAIVEIETPDSKKQIQHFNPDKGYLSCNEWFVHFGVGKNDSVKVSIIWPNGNSQVLKGLSANNVYTLDIKNSAPKPIVKENTSTVFRDITSKTNVSYNHKENTYIDFKLEPLLPHQFSQMGPCIAVADINGDGRDDFFIGGSKDNDGSVFVQDSSGKFAILKEPNISADKKYEDTAAEFIDADNDGDNDLLVVSGGNEYPENENMYPVRLYANDGKGNFGKNTTSLPSIYTSSKAIAVDDFDNDGDKDIFIGGRVVPGHYGLMPKSYLLQNKNGQFTDITSSIPVIANIGMVTDAIWCDVDNNGWKDLVLVGEWMPLTIFYNINGKLDTTPFILEKSYGWWNTITANDIDKDGDVDLIGGNISANTRYRGNEEYPMTMVVNDFDNNGSTDCIVSLYQSDGVSYPIALRDNILDQMNYLKKKFLRYKEYSNATINEIFTPEQLSAAKTFKVNCITNTIFVNDGKKNFSLQNLSVKAQIFPINSILADDYDKDGITDLLVAGNDYTTEIESGRNDAGIGLMLIGSGNTKFNSVPVKKSGFYVPGDVKCMKKISIHNKPAIIVGKNKDYLQFIGLTESTN